MKNLLLCIAIGLIFSSCASILNPKYQKIDIKAPNKSEVTINGEEPEMANGKYKVERNLSPKEITVSKEGYKDKSTTILQYKKSPIYFFSWVPFGIMLYPPFYDRGPRSFNYDKEVRVGQKMAKLPVKEALTKEVQLNKVSVDLKDKDVKYRTFYSYRGYLRNEDKKKTKDAEIDTNVKLENTIFTDALNEVLRDNGFIDTTKTVFKDSYQNNLFLNATVTGVTFHYIANRGSTKFNYVDMEIKWEVLDYYKKNIYSQTIKSTSDKLRVRYDERQYDLRYVIKDGLEYGLLELMNSSKMKKILKDNSQKTKEAEIETLVLKSSGNYVSSMSEAVKSSVTIKTKDGHGSGFIVSSDGYIVTNYHVIAEMEDLKIILNDKTEYTPTLARESKLYDLALLKIDAKGFKPMKILATKDVEIASAVFAVGTPTVEDLSQTVSKGIISGMRTSESGIKFIQTDASVNSGNSGGALTNERGEVLGVVSAKLKGFGIEGVAFGVPAYEILDKLKIEFK